MKFGRFILRVLVRTGTQHNHYAYWTGRSFCVNRANARHYKHESKPLRAMKHLIKFVSKYNGNPKRGVSGISPQDLGLYAENDQWDNFHGLLEVCVEVHSYGQTEVVPVNNHCISWLKGPKSFYGGN